VTTQAHSGRLAREWSAFAYVASGWLIGLVCSIVLLTGLVLGVGLSILGVGIPIFFLTLALARLGARGERARAALVLDAPIRSPTLPARSGSIYDRAMRRLKDRLTWRELAYLLVLGPVGVIIGSVAVALWSGALAALASPVLHALAPTGSFLGDLVLPEMIGLVAGGIVLAGIASGITRALASAEAQIAAALLAPDEAAELTARVSRLEATRAAAVESSDARLRRIERDLHDGAQHRLTYIAMELDRAREKLASDPAATEALLTEAHHESLRALGELRDVVRGIHPSVLTDRGLDAAISGLAERSPVAVDIRVELPTRPPPGAETAAYYVVAESLTNVAKHADARRVSVSIRQDGARLVAEVADDGHGGARRAPGSGLDGLAQRVEALDGSLTVTSPDGGPTLIRAEIPCAS
jgi:signal transduction histidine kinase